MLSKHKKVMLLCISILILSGCARYEPFETVPESPAETENAIIQMFPGKIESIPEETVDKEGARSENTETTRQNHEPVKGIYVSAYVAGTNELMQNIIDHIDSTEINTVVIDVKSDDGRVTFSVDNEIINEVGAVKRYIGDIDALIKQLKEHDIYIIARIVAFRDPYISEQRPDWCIKLADGSLFKDNNDMTWINPYKKDAWEYLAEIGKSAGAAGFDEVQFDYIRFCAEKGMNKAVFDEADVNGKSKTEIITEFTDYIYEELKNSGLYVSADVFGAIINNEEDSQSVGQNYEELAEKLDAISPMIYPSHYANGNFGIEYPDTRPYDTVLAALKGSREVLDAKPESRSDVRPWLQDFTASYLENYIDYGPKEIRAQIDAVYDAGYKEWLLWSAACKYSWDGLNPE